MGLCHNIEMFTHQTRVLTAERAKPGAHNPILVDRF